MTQLTGGGFQDALGRPISNGSLTLILNQDGHAASNVVVFAGVTITIDLDANGNVAGVQSVWANADLTPSGSFYFVNTYDNIGTLMNSDPLTLTIPSGATYNLGTWIP